MNALSVVSVDSLYSTSEGGRGWSRRIAHTRRKEANVGRGRSHASYMAKDVHWDAPDSWERRRTAPVIIGSDHSSPPEFSRLWTSLNVRSLHAHVIFPYFHLPWWAMIIFYFLHTFFIYSNFQKLYNPYIHTQIFTYICVCISVQKLCINPYTSYMIVIREIAEVFL